MASPRTRRVLQDLRTSNENNRCFECNTHNPQWASVSLGIWICLECSGKHRSLGVHLSFVRSLTMDKWKDTELEKMKVGGNRCVRDFLESQDDWDDSRHITVKYNCRAAALLRDKISTESQGRPWSVATSSVSKQKSTSSSSSGASRASSHSAGTMHKSASSPTADAMLSAHGEGGYQSAGGGYEQGTGGYQQMGGGGGYQSGGGGYVDPKQAFFDRRQAENAARPDNLAPSQGGRYSGFGYSMDPAPRAQSSEVMDTALQALTSGWSLLSVGATKMARSATDSALKISSTATEKITEVSQTVSDKMREGTLGDELLSQAQQVAGKVTDMSRRGLGQVQTWVGNPGAAGNNRLDYQSPAGNSRGERSSLLAAGNGAGNGSAGGYQQIQNGPESGGGAPLMSGDPGNNGQDWGWESANSSTKSGGVSSDLQWGSGAAWEDAHLAAPLTKAAKSRGASNSSKKSANVSSAPAASSVKSSASASDEASLIDLDGSGKDQWKSWEDDAWDSLTRKG